jgi:hypothetical protein
MPDELVSCCTDYTVIGRIFNSFLIPSTIISIPNYTTHDLEFFSQTAASQSRFQREKDKED